MKLTLVVLSCLSFLPVVLSLASDGSLSQNAKRMARAIRHDWLTQLYHVHSRPSTPTPDLPTPTAAAIRAVVIDQVGPSSTSASAPSETTAPFKRRQTIGTSIGHLSVTGQLVTTSPDVRFSVTTDTEEGPFGVYATDHQSASGIVGYICLANDNSVDQTRDQPITLSENSGEYATIATCGADLDQPAGSPPTNEPGGVEPNYYGETRVWDIDSSGLISFTYTNPGGSVVYPVPVIVTCPTIDAISWSIFVTGNVALFREAYLNSANFGNSGVDPTTCVVNELGLYYSST